jgi:hypothetical protein
MHSSSYGIRPHARVTMQQFILTVKSTITDEYAVNAGINENWGTGRGAELKYCLGVGLDGGGLNGFFGTKWAA